MTTTTDKPPGARHWTAATTYEDGTRVHHLFSLDDYAMSTELGDLIHNRVGAEQDRAAIHQITVATAGRTITYTAHPAPKIPTTNNKGATPR